MMEAMREIDVVSGEAPFAETVTIGSHVLTSDEPRDAGGDDRGPAPHELLVAALGACTAMTLQAYARRKGWPLERVRVHLGGGRQGDAFHIARAIALEGPLSDEQRTRLREIAEKCPVHRTLTGTIHIATELVPRDQVEEADLESFPASDAPAWTLGKDED